MKYNKWWKGRFPIALLTIGNTIPYKTSRIKSSVLGLVLLSFEIMFLMSLVILIEKPSIKETPSNKPSTAFAKLNAPMPNRNIGMESIKNIIPKAIEWRKCEQQIAVRSAISPEITIGIIKFD